MRKLNIEITKAQIESFTVSFDPEKDTPQVSVSIGLYTDHGKKITQYCISTTSWQQDNKFEIPIEIISPILEIGQSLEVVATRHCREGQQALSAPK